jgi:hypothetical protein
LGKQQDSLKGLDFSRMLRDSAFQISSEQGPFANSALSMIKEQDLYKRFAGITNRYGFTPEQLVTVGAGVSMAYIENLKSGLFDEKKATANSLMDGFKGMKSIGASALMGSLGNSSNAAKLNESVASERNLALVSKYMPQREKLFALL